MKLKNNESITLYTFTDNQFSSAIKQAEDHVDKVQRSMPSNNAFKLTGVKVKSNESGSIVMVFYRMLKIAIFLFIIFRIFF